MGNSQLETELGYRFVDPLLLNEALTHGSGKAGSKSVHVDFQRLEFLGDRVLSLVIADKLFRHFPGEQEGKLAARLSLLVRAETCAFVGAQINLGNHIMVGASEQRKGVHNMPSVVADVVEALIGAIYIDGGLEAARKFILSNWESQLQTEPGRLKDDKTFVQEWALGKALPLPIYIEESRDGPQHAPIFTIVLKVAGLADVKGVGSSKQVAEMAAARALIGREQLK